MGIQNNAPRFVTVGTDGRLCVWNLGMLNGPPEEFQDLTKVRSSDAINVTTMTSIPGLTDKVEQKNNNH